MKLTIGRNDKADFPELNLENIGAKVDTGAFTSSIHCHHIKECEIDGVKHIEFYLLDPSHPEYNNEKFTSTKFKRKSIKNSFGKAENRYIIETTILLFNKVYPIELSLSVRSEMKFPILLGRKLLNRRFVVDTTKHDLSYKMKLKNSNKK